MQRRRSSYKPTFPLLFNTTGHSAPVEEPQKSFLRERFKARCFERVKKDREKARRKASGSSDGGSSDADGDFDMDDDEESDTDDSLMQDEVRTPISRLIFNFILTLFMPSSAISTDHDKHDA